jgi:hypothetical protein
MKSPAQLLYTSSEKNETDIQMIKVWKTGKDFKMTPIETSSIKNVETCKEYFSFLNNKEKLDEL